MRELANILTSSIDPSERRFEVNYHADLTSLKDSIRRVGILDPLRVRRIGDASYEIISGFRRFGCVLELQWPNIPVIIGDDSRADLTLFKGVIEENFFTRSYNMVEKGIILDKLKVTFDVPRDVIVQDYLPFLGFDRSEKIFRIIEKVNNLDDAIKIHIVNADLPIHIVSDFQKFSEIEQRGIVPFIESFHFSKSQLKELLTWTFEICLRDKITVKTFLSEPIFQEVIQNTALADFEKLKQFRKALKLRRYPKLMELESKFLEFKKILGLPLEAPNFFEDNLIKMKVSFRDKQEFQTWIDRMQRAFEKAEMEEMIKII